MNPSEDSINNPYAAPKADLGSMAMPHAGGPVAIEQAEDIRRHHISHEASIRSIGSLYLLGGILSVLGVVTSVVGLVTQIGAGGMGVGFVTMAVSIGFSAGFTALQIFLGLGLRKLRTWAQIGTGILTALGLLYFAFVIVYTANGAMPTVAVLILLLFAAIPAYIMWLLVSAKGRFIFTPEYRAIREMTPHIKYKTSIIVKIFLGILLTIIFLGVVMVVVAVVGVR